MSILTPASSNSHIPSSKSSSRVPRAISTALAAIMLAGGAVSCNKTDKVPCKESSQQALRENINVQAYDGVTVQIL